MCGAREHCGAYSVESSRCYLASASGLIGESSDSPSAKTIYLNTKLKPGDEIKIFLNSLAISLLSCLKRMVSGPLGALGQIAWTNVMGL